MNLNGAIVALCIMAAVFGGIILIVSSIMFYDKFDDQYHYNSRKRDEEVWVVIKRHYKQTAIPSAIALVGGIFFAVLLA